MLFFLIFIFSPAICNEEEHLLEPFKCDASLVGKTRIVDAKIGETYEEFLKARMEGRVEVCLPAPTSLQLGGYYWGTICSQYLSTTTLNAMCASLHYSNVSMIHYQFRSKLVRELFESPPPEQPRFLSGLVCPEDTTSNLSQCTYDTCSSLLVNYIACRERLQCHVCPSDVPCNYATVSDSVERCSPTQTHCIRHVTVEGGTEEEVMGCSDRTCQDILESCQGNGEPCYCNECSSDKCNFMFLQLLDVNVRRILDPSVSFAAFLMEKFNFIIRLILFDIAAWTGLFLD